MLLHVLWKENKLGVNFKYTDFISDRQGCLSYKKNSKKKLKFHCNFLCRKRKIIKKNWSPKNSYTLVTP